MGRVKEVGYERLYSFGKYENEKFRLNAEVQEGEDSNKVIAELFLKVCQIQKCLETYRFLENYILEKEDSVETIEADISREESHIASMKATIDEITKAIKEGRADADKRLRHACDRENYKDSVERNDRRKKDLVAAKRALKNSIKLRDTIKKRIKEGNFNIEDIKIPRPKFDYYRHHY